MPEARFADHGDAGFGTFWIWKSLNAAVWFDRLDKHSTGGVGDVTSLMQDVVAPAVVTLPMISGRGLTAPYRRYAGQTGSDPGFDIFPDDSASAKIIKMLAYLIIRADQLPRGRQSVSARDITATVDSIP